MTEILQYAVLGLGAASAYTLLGAGVVLINRGTGVVNFSQAAMALIGALIHRTLHEEMGVPLTLSMIIAVGSTALLGLLTYQVIMRPLSGRSPVERTISTLGILIFIQALAALIWGVQPMTAANLLPRDTIDIFGVVFSSDRVILFMIGALVTLALWLSGRYTRMGLALRALSENPRAIGTLGWSPVQLGMFVWTFGAGLAGVAGILIAPVAGLVIGSMPLMIIPVLAAVLMASFKSFPLLFVASIAIGVGQSLTFNFLPLPGAQQSLPFILILIVLLTRRRATTSRSQIVERLPLVGTGRVPWLAVGIIVLVLAAGMLFFFNRIFLTATIMTFGWSLIVLSVVILLGYTGQLSLAQATMAGMSGLIATKLVADLGVNFLAAILIGLIATIIVGLVFALPALRTRGIDLAIVTLGLASIVWEIFFKNEFFTGDFGIVRNQAPALDVFGLNIAPVKHPERYAIFALVLFVLGCFVVAAIRRGTAGGRLLAVRTNDRAASALGVDVVGAKLFAFAVAAGVAAAGGIVLAFASTSFKPESFTPMLSISVIAFAFMGGAGYIIGAPAGGQFAPGSFGSWLTNIIAPGADGVWLQLLSGLFLILFILINPDGFARDWVRAAKRIQRRFSRQHAAAANEGLKTPEDPETEQISKVKVQPITLEVGGLSVRFGEKVKAVDNVSFTVNPGEVVALIGPNGAGKSTCIDAITGFVKSTGRITLDGKDITRLHAFRRARLGMGRSFQSLELFESLTVRDNLLIAADEGNWTTYAWDLVAPKRPALGALALAAVREFGLETDLETRVDDLPYGKRRLVAVARAMAGEPSVLLLDEPAAGLGDEETAEFEHVIRRIAGWGVAVLLVEHDMKLVMGVSDQVVVMETGKLLAVGTPQEVRTNPTVVEAYLGRGVDSAEPVNIIGGSSAYERKAE